MTNGATGGAAAGAAAAAAAVAQAIRASGAIVRVEPHDFSTILGRTANPLVVCARGGFLSTKYDYLTAYRGLIFYTRAETPLQLPDETETIQARKIWIPQ